MLNQEMKHFFPYPLIGPYDAKRKKKKKILSPREFTAIFFCRFAHKQHPPDSSLESGPRQHQEKAEKLQKVVLQPVSVFSYGDYKEFCAGINYYNQL